MSGCGWRTSLIAPARALSERSTQVVVGLVETDDGELTFAIKIGADSEPVVLPEQSANEFIANAHETLAEKLRLSTSGGGA
jgi:hypothetical protein